MFPVISYGIFVREGWQSDGAAYLRRSELVTTQTEERTIAAVANMGVRVKPTLHSTPAASGMPITL